MSKNSFVLSSVLTFLTVLTSNAESVIAQQEQLRPIAAPQPFDKASINGSWKPVKGTLVGRELPKEQLDSILLTINNGAYETHGTGFEESGKMVIPIPATNQFQPIDVVIEKGSNAGTTIQGIVRVEGETLVVCYAISGERPTIFESKEGEQTLLLEYEKVQGFRSVTTPRIIIQEEDQLNEVNDGQGK